MLNSIRIRLILSHLIAILLVMGLSGFLLLSFLRNYFLQSIEDSLLAQAHITTQVLIPGAIAQAPFPDTFNKGVAAHTGAYNYSFQDSIGTEDNLFLYNQVDIGQLAQTETLTGTRLFYSPIITGTQNSFFEDDVDLSFLQNASLQLGAQLNTRIRILNNQGEIIIDSRTSDNKLVLQMDPLTRQALQGEYASQTETVDEQEVLSVAVPALVQNRLVGVVYLSQPLDSVTLVLQDLQIRWLLSTGIAIFLVGVVALLLSQAITKPLQHLTNLVNNLSRQQLIIQPPSLPPKRGDEIGHLHLAFNEMTTRLQAAQQMQVDFVANVSHELRTPLTSVKGMVETLQDGAVNDLQVRDRFLSTIAQETERLIRLVKDLLLLSRADSNALQLQNQMTDLVALAKTTINQIQPQLLGRHLRVEQESTAAELFVWADPDRVRQILLNLLDNAIKYSRPHSTIVVSMEPYAEDLVVVAIEDEGMGIDASHLSHVGQRFYRTDKARSRGMGGSGLGLAIARALVEAHKGELWIESEEGVGTTVFFTLPSH